MFGSTMSRRHHQPDTTHNDAASEATRALTRFRDLCGSYIETGLHIDYEAYRRADLELEDAMNALYDYRHGVRAARGVADTQPAPPPMEFDAALRAQLGEQP